MDKNLMAILTPSKSGTILFVCSQSTAKCSLIYLILFLLCNLTVHSKMSDMVY